MFIGASSASTGGGIKTTTVFMVMLSVMSMVRGKQDNNVFKRRINDQTMRKAFSISCLALCVVLIDTVAISEIETITHGTRDLADVLFEVSSAFGTVGLSTGITPELFSVSKLLIIITMFIGRLGPLSLSMAISGAASKPDALHYPEDRLIVG
jgi:trk system potassium uptake protein TrkH